MKKKTLHTKILEHFNNIANAYDHFKNEKPYYYDAIFKGITPLIKRSESVLDFGCGTGTLLVRLNPVKAVGYDPSFEMIRLAKQKFSQIPQIRFVSDLTPIQPKFDHVLLIDVVEHLASIEDSLKEIDKYLKKGGTLIVSYVDRKWEPILLVMEWLKLKMPEGPHDRISVHSFVTQAQKYHFKLISQQNKQIHPLFPFKPLSILVFQK